MLELHHHRAGLVCMFAKPQRIMPAHGSSLRDIRSFDQSPAGGGVTHAAAAMGAVPSDCINGRRDGGQSGDETDSCGGAASAVRLGRELSGQRGGSSTRRDVVSPCGAVPVAKL